MKKIEIFDSTLRDGAQGEGISFSVRDKLLILRALDDFGADYVEAGNPSSNPKDAEFFAKAAEIPLLSAKLTAFGSTRRRGITPAEDAGLASLLASGAKAAAIFGKAHLLHAERVLGVDAAENIELVASTIEYLRERMAEVIFDAEHFFDGYRYDPEHAMAVIDAAFEAGADCVTLCDTNGGTLPDEIAEITGIVANAFPGRRIGIHTHDDSGLAVANAMAAVKSGATMVQGTLTGIGERCGNCDLSVIIPNLTLKCGLQCGKNPVKLASLMETARRVSDIANNVIRPTKPYTGKSAFAHKGGMHIDANSKLPGCYEHIDPALVGNKRRLLLSEVSGRATVVEKARQIIPGLDRSSPETAMLTDKLKELEHEGYQFEAADASFELLIRKQVMNYRPHFHVVMYKATDDFPSTDGKLQASAMIQVEVDGKTEMAASLGNGPVNALDAALKRALSVFYPVLSEVTLTDFKVRVIESNSTTAARVRVLIESTDSRRVWTTVGVSNDIIEASFEALCDSMEYKLSME
ncbi:MAG: citramalate synthase [Ruminococcaceae bacterium]|nr:citramalate synthase [Oscillospiraceae bacterium]